MTTSRAALLDPPVRPSTAGTLEVALVVPLQGPAGIFGPSCEQCAQLAVEEINATHGVLGRELRLLVVDGGAPPERVANDVDVLVSAGAVDAVTGWHISAVRQVVAPRIAGRVPYVYTALYEGGERTPGVFLTGETPARQVRPALRWMAEQLGVRRWVIVGDDYVWPKQSAAATRRYAHELRLVICDEIYVRLGTADFDQVVLRVAAKRPDGVLMFLVGDDAVAFNRAFGRFGLDSTCVRFSPLMDENMLLASGADNTRRLFAAAAFFESLATRDSLDFGLCYNSKFGPDAPVLNSMGESCYEGVRLLVELLNQAASDDLRRICAASEGVGYDGPRGSVHLHDRHLNQRVFLATADGLDFDVIDELRPQRPLDV